MDFWLKDRKALTFWPAVHSSGHQTRRGRTKMTGPPSSSYPSQVPPPAAVISPENEEKSSGFDKNFAGFVLRRPATDSGK
ncbi:unnamed protein product [Prunus armeniaca]